MQHGKLPGFPRDFHGQGELAKSQRPETDTVCLAVWQSWDEQLDQLGMETFAIDYGAADFDLGTSLWGLNWIEPFISSYPSA